MPKILPFGGSRLFSVEKEKETFNHRYHGKKFYILVSSEPFNDLDLKLRNLLISLKSTWAVEKKYYRTTPPQLQS